MAFDPPGRNKPAMKHKSAQTRRRVAAIGLSVVLALGVSGTSVAQQFGFSPLIEAILDSNLYNVRAALLGGANPNTKRADGTPAIVIAAGADKYPQEMVQLLLQQDARPDERDRQGNTALVVATRRAHKGLINVLLYYKADPDLPGENGEVPLMIAVVQNNPDIVRQLIDAGADVNATDYTGRTPLAIAREGRNRGITEMIEQAGGVY